MKTKGARGCGTVILLNPAIADDDRDPRCAVFHFVSDDARVRELVEFSRSARLRGRAVRS